MFDLPGFKAPFPDFVKNPVLPAPPPESGVIMGGLKSGGYGMLGALAGAGSGLAKIAGADQTSAALGQKAAEYQADAATVGRQDIEKQGWTEDGVGGFFKKLGYTAAQAVPSIVGAGALGAAAAAALPAEAALSGGVGAAGLLGRAGAALPSFLGGGEAVAGARTLAGIGGAAGVMVPQSFGEQVNAQADQPGGLTRGGALRAAAQAVPVGLAQSVVPAEGAVGGLLGQLGGRFGTSAAAKFAEHGITNAAAGAVGAGAQTAADLSFDPTKSASDKAAEILHAAGQGAIGSGLLGGAFGMFGKPTPERLTKHVDDVLADQGLDPANPKGTALATVPQPGLPLDPNAPEPMTPQAPKPQLALPAPADILRTRDGRIFDTTPQPPRPETPLNEVQPEIPLSASATTAPVGTQFGLMDEPRPYDPGTAPRPRTRAEAIAEVKAQRAAAAAAAPDAEAAPEAMTFKEALKVPDAPPPNTFLKRAITDLKLPTRNETPAFKEFLANSTATNPVELYKELDAVKSDDAPIAKSNAFIALAKRLGVGVDNLEEKLAAAKTPADKKLYRFQIGLRDAAAQLRDAAQSATVAPEPAEPARPIAAVQAPDDIAIPEIPERHPEDAVTTPAVTQTADAARAAEHASPEIQTLGPHVTAAPAPAPDANLPTAPKSVAEKVVDAARAAVGPKGGEVDIASLRAALPDMAPKDLENALREIHADDTDHSLTQNPKGQRTRVDGVTVPGIGKFHKLELAPQEGADAVQVGGAAPQAAADQSGSGAQAGSGDAAGSEIARAGETLGSEAGPSGEAEPAGQGATQAPVSQFVAKARAAVEARRAAKAQPAATGELDATLPVAPVRDANGFMIRKPGESDRDFAIRDRIHQLTFGPPDGPGAIPQQLLDAKLTANTIRLIGDHQVGGERRQSITETNKADQDRRDAYNAKVDASPREVIPSIPDGPNMHPIVGRKNAVLSYLNGLSDEDFKDLSKAYGRPLRNEIGNTLEPEKVQEQMENELRLIHQSRATEAKIAPQDPNVRTPEQTAQQAAKTVATANILAAPPAAKDVGKPVVVKLRKQTRNKTAIIETPNGDQIPTEAVGGTAADIPQALAPVVDPVQPAPPAEPMAKMPFDRQPGIADNAPALPREDVDAHVAKFVSKLRPEVVANVHVIGSDAELPPEITGAMAQIGKNPADIPAMYYDGKVYIRADQMRNHGEVEDALAHEILGHMATAKRFPGASTYQNAMAPIFDRAGGFAGIEKLARQAGVWHQDSDGHNLQNGAGLSEYVPENPDRATPLQKARVVDELMAHVGATTPSALDRAIFTVQDGIRKAIVNTLRRAGMSNFAKRLDTFTRADLAKWMADNRKALAEPPKPGQIDLAAGASDPRLFLHDAEPIGQPPFMAKIAGQQRDTQGVMGAVGSVLDHIQNNIVYKELFGAPIPNPERATVADRARQVRNYFLEQFAPARGIAEEGALNGMHGLVDHLETAAGPRNVIETRMKQVSDKASQQHFDLKAIAPDHDRTLSEVMAKSTLKQLDPELPWDKHAWLLQDTSIAPDQLAQLKTDHEQLVRDFQKLGQPAKGGVKTNAQQIYRDQRASHDFNWYMAAAQTLHSDLSDIGGIDPGYSPAHRYAGIEAGADPKAAELLHNDIYASKAFAKQAYEDMMAVAQKHALENDDGTKPFIDLKNTIKQNREAEVSQLSQGPYFRVGRRGEYMVAGKIKSSLDADGNPTERPDPAALAAIKKVVEEKFPQVMMGMSDDNRSYFVRFDKQSTAEAFANLFQRNGPLRRHIDEEHDTRTAMMSDSKNGLSDVLPSLQTHIDQAAALYDRDLARMPDGPSKDALKEARDKYIGNLRASYINLRGDTSMASVLARRQNVQGGNADMARNQQEASSAYSRDIAFTATRTKLAEGLAQARDAIDQASRSGEQDATSKSARMQRIYDAYEGRNKAANIRVDNSFLSWTKRFMHPFQLAMSPAYVAMNASQLATLTLPEFVKFHGYARSTAALANALIPAGRVIAAMVRKNGIYEGGITKAVLDGARLGDARDFTSDMVNHGHYELGSFTANQSGLSPGAMSRTQKFLHFANSTALLAETYTRLVAGFAAKELHDNMSKGPDTPAKASMLRQFPTPLDYAGHVVADTMMEWGNANTPKFMTAGGPLGKASPAVFQFHGWVPRLLEKLYREAANGYTNRLGPGAEADAMRAEAKSFTKSHLAAVTALSGGLGLPFVSTGLGAATRASGLVQDQPTDMEAGLRSFLADTFGKDMGEVLSRGVPRYLGTDMADLGDKDFIPFARLIEDRRKLEDAIPDYASHAWGSSVGMATNALLAMREMSEGRFSEAGARSLPTVLRNIVRAYRVDQYGYTTSTGESLPVAAGPAEVAKTALGFKGGEITEEHERQASLSGLTADRSYASGLIKRNYMLSYTRGDQEGMQQALDAARQYDKDNPGQRLTSQFQNLVASRLKAEAYSRQSGTLGVMPKDVRAREVTSF